MSVVGGYIRGRTAEGYDSLSAACIFPPAGSGVGKLTVSSPMEPSAIIHRDQVVEPYSVWLVSAHREYVLYLYYSVPETGMELSARVRGNSLVPQVAYRTSFSTRSCGY